MKNKTEIKLYHYSFIYSFIPSAYLSLKNLPLKRRFSLILSRFVSGYADFRR